MTTILAARELVLDAERTHLDDARVDVTIVGDDARLAAGEADRVAAELADGHRQQRHRDALAGGQQHVELAPVGVGRDLLGEAEELVGRVAHRRDDDHDVVPGAPRAHDAIGDLLDAGDVGDARAAVFLDDDGHCSDCRKSRLQKGEVTKELAYSTSFFVPFCNSAMRLRSVSSNVATTGA